MNHTLKAHIGSQVARQVNNLPYVLLSGDPLKMHKSQFEQYLKARLAEALPGDEAVLIDLIEKWRAAAREHNRAKRSYAISRSEAKRAAMVNRES